VSGLGTLAILAIVGGSEAPSRVQVAVVEVGHCSGTLVAADLVLTSAHCLDGPVDAVVVDGRVVRAVQCAHHPAYEPGRPAHDIGY
jgi:Trypsin